MAYRAPKPKPRCVDARQWLQGRNGRGCLAPLTGGTSRVFSAYLHLVDAWVVYGGRDAARIEVALRECAALLQRSEWKLAAEAIANAGDWCHIEELWPKIKPDGAPDFFYDAEAGRVVSNSRDWS